ncbi:MAG: hypothetical protein NVS3B19_15920 [Ginsengibacter sp.]
MSILIVSKLKYLKMKTNSPRRKFLGNVAAGMASLAALSVPKSIKAAPELLSPTNDADEWFKKVKGKHRMVFDVPQPHSLFPFAWSRVFLMTNMATGTPANENSVVVVLRHSAIPFALSDSMWSKYKFGESFKVDDHLTGKPAVRNPFWAPKPGDFKVPGIGNVAIGINELQQDGVMFCVCDVALTVNSTAMSSSFNMSPEEIKKDWINNLIPGIQVVPSGVWAVGRAQEHGCTYCYTG